MQKKNYGITAEDYLKRASYCIEQDDPQYFFYAALNLRCGIESRIREYLNVWSHVPKRAKRDWQLGKLEDSCEKYLLKGDTIQILKISLEDGSRVTLKYHPPTKRLRELGHKLGNYLHDIKAPKALDDKWWAGFKLLLQEAGSHLDFVCKGDLLGPARLKEENGTERIVVKSLLLSNGHKDLLLKMEKGIKGSISVEYLDFETSFTPNP